MMQINHCICFSDVPAAGRDVTWRSRLHSYNLGLVRFLPYFHITVLHNGLCIKSVGKVSCRHRFVSGIFRMLTMLISLFFSLISTEFQNEGDVLLSPPMTDRITSTLVYRMHLDSHDCGRTTHKNINY